MFNETIECNGVVVEVERANPRRTPTRRAQYMYALGKAYPMLNDLNTTAGVLMLGEVAPFIEAAVHIKTIVGAPFPKWPDPASEKAVAAAYDWWTEESRQDLADLIKETCERLDNPNGTSAGVLTEDEAKDPLSGIAAKDSAND